MEFGKKLLIGALILLAGAGIGEYSLYKKFEKSPNLIGEVLRWPYNDIYTECDRLAEEFKSLENIELKSVSGRISSLDGLEGYTYKTSPNCGRWHYTIRRDAISFIEMDDGQKFAYTGDFFAGKDDKVVLRVLPTKEISRSNEFLEQVRRFRDQYPTWLWATQGYDAPLSQLPNIKKSVKNIPLTKLEHLEGIVEDYQIIEDN